MNINVKQQAEQAQQAVRRLENDLQETRDQSAGVEAKLEVLDKKLRLTAADLVKETNLTRELGRLERQATKVERELEAATTKHDAAREALRAEEHRAALQRFREAEKAIAVRAREVDAELREKMDELHALMLEAWNLGPSPAETAQRESLFFPRASPFTTALEVAGAGLKSFAAIEKDEKQRALAYEREANVES